MKNKLERRIDKASMVTHRGAWDDRWPVRANLPRLVVARVSVQQMQRIEKVGERLWLLATFPFLSVVGLRAKHQKI
jgi:hypothetical protein